jgi:hypothetical protein
MLKYLVNNLVLGGENMQVVTVILEILFEVVVKLEKLNEGRDGLSCILSGEDAGNLYDSLSDAQLFIVNMVDEYFADIVQFLSIEMALSNMTVAQKKKLVVKVAYY